MDVDFTSAELVGENTGDTGIKTFTQELRLSQTVDSVDWMLGAFYFDETVNYDNVVTYDADMNAYGNILSGGAINAIQQALVARDNYHPGSIFSEPDKARGITPGRTTRRHRFSGRLTGILRTNGR